MNTQLEPIAALLKTARERKGLSQLALGQRVGLPQSHISKIESGAVDLQTSNLIEIARALDLELTLLPRSILPAVQALQAQPAALTGAGWVDRPLNQLVKHAKVLQRRLPRVTAFQQLIEAAEELRRLRFNEAAAHRLARLIGTLNDALVQLRRPRATRSNNRTKELLDVIASRTDDLRRLRNELVHGLSPQPSAPLPAYRLDDDGEDDE